jgi:LytS/YehU family sensor histidine kinase
MLTGVLVLFIAAALLNLRRPRLPRPLALTIAVVAGCLLAYGIMSFVCNEFVFNNEFFFSTIYFARQAALPWAFAVAAWYFVQRASERAAALREHELGRQRLEMRMVEARLTVMQAQVEPHFLFNTLAHVKRLCQTDPALARRMLDSFCDYLRVALPQMRANTATLGSELDLVRAYLDIQRIRMGRRLDVEVAVPAMLHGFAFPPMMLMSLVENAVKHGLSPMVEGGRIRVDAVARGITLHVSVTDTGQGFIKSSGTGIGLANISSRLASLYGRAGSLSLAHNAPQGAVVTIALPVVGAA